MSKVKRKPKRYWTRSKAKSHGYRSGFEMQIAEDLKSRGVDYEYETLRITYIPPERERTYTPDFILPNGIIVEAKGRWLANDRRKHVLVREQHPDLDIRILFMDPNCKIFKTAKSTVAEWATAKGIKWAKGPEIPQEWIDEKPRS